VNLGTFGGASGIVLEASTPPFYALYWLALVVALLACGSVVALLHSPASLALRAVRDDEDVARQMGVRSFRVKLGAFALAAFLTGVAGGLQALKSARSAVWRLRHGVDDRHVPWSSWAASPRAAGRCWHADLHRAGRAAARSARLHNAMPDCSCCWPSNAPQGVWACSLAAGRSAAAGGGGG
jgi:hypothetical protein